MGPSTLRRRPRGAAVVAVVLAAGVLTAVGAAQAGLSQAGAIAKPGPDAVPATTGAPVGDSPAGAKQGVLLGAPASVRAGKVLSAEVSPALNGYSVVFIKLQ